jgi:hypothetical protein
MVPRPATTPPPAPARSSPKRRSSISFLTATLVIAALIMPGAISAADTEKPRYLEIAVTGLTPTSAQVTWALDRPAMGRLEYGPTRAYGSKTKKENSFRYATHIQTIKGLKPGTTYHFRAISEDAAGNWAASKDHTFTTKRKKVPAPGPRRTSADTKKPRYLRIAVTQWTRTSATVTWTLDEPAKGRLQYGPTRAYGSKTRKENSFRYDTHIQTIRGLKPGTTYRFRAISEDAASNWAASGDHTFATKGSVSPVPTPTPSPPATQAPKLTNGEVYGPGVAIDSKSNFRIGVGGLKLSHRFRASTSSKLLSVAWQRRLGPGYSAGDGGIARISVQTDDGSGRPSGTILAQLRYDVPSRPATGVLIRNTFPAPAHLSAGKLYHIVFENVHPRPLQNYFSVNDLFTWRATTPRQPALSQDYAVLTSRSGWSVDARHTADMDLVYADGTRDGLAYIGILGHDYALIGGARMVRERFTVSGGDRTVRQAHVRVGRQAGSGDLTIRLEDASGRVLERGTVAASRIPSWKLGDFRSANGAWVGFTFSQPRTLRNGQTYRLVLSAPSGTQFSAVPIHHSQDNTTDTSGDPLRTRVHSPAFRDGAIERSSDGGRSWSRVYQWSPNNLQFYLR